MSSDRNTCLPGRFHDYKVGYGKPPAAHRFKKGRSGNPAGRRVRSPANPRYLESG